MTRLLLILFSIIVMYSMFGECHQKVLLERVKTLTLVDKEKTTGRRNSPIPQLSCVGGGARGKFRPRVVQCVQTGHDGIDFQWRCSADMPHEYEFGKIVVVCEGYDYPEDPYILAGSCALEYNLEYAADGKSSRDSYGIKKTGVSGWSDMIAPAVAVCFIAFVAYMMCSGNRNDSPPPYPGSGLGGGGPGYPPGPGGPPPPYDSFGGSGKGNSTTYTAGVGAGAQDGPGFWSGAALGGLGGYLFGRNQNPAGGATRTNMGPSTSQFGRDTGFRRSPSPQPTTSDMRESTGYGGTRRR